MTNEIIDFCDVCVLNDKGGSIADIFYFGDKSKEERTKEKEKCKKEGHWYMTLRESVDFVKNHPTRKNYFITETKEINDIVVKFLRENGFPEDQIFS